MLGEYTDWDVEASMVGANLLARLTSMDEYELCRKTKKILRGDYYSQFKVNVPVVLLGSPVKAYAEELGELIDAEIIVPRYADVGNALGALVGKGIKRFEILVRSFYKKSERSILAVEILI